jgi:hypothetical protein
MILDYPLAMAEIGNALLAPQALQYDTELFFGREFLPVWRGDVSQSFEPGPSSTRISVPSSILERL